MRTICEYRPFMKETICEYRPSLCLYDKAQPLQCPGMLCARGDEIDPRCLEAGMAQYVGKLYNVPVRFVKGSSKKMAQVVRKNL